jgi:1,6-anhydro-N-acetylmuramate kinase
MTTETQVGALADVLVQLPELETLQLSGNDLDDQAFALLGSQVRACNPRNTPHACKSLLLLCVCV